MQRSPLRSTFLVGEPYVRGAGEEKSVVDVAHGRTRGYTKGMKRVGLPAPVGNWITVEEAAKKLGMSTRGVHSLVKRKQLRRYRFGKAVAFLDGDVERVASRQPTTGRPRKGFAPRASKAAI